MRAAELEERAEQALALTRSAGADGAWASATRSRGVEVDVRDGAIEKLGPPAEIFAAAARRAADAQPSVVAGQILPRI